MIGLIASGMGFLGLLGLLVLSLRPSAPTHGPQRRVENAPPVPPIIPTADSTNTSTATPDAPRTDAPPAPEPEVPGPLPYRTVTSEQWGVQLEIPREWVVEPQERGFTISPPDDSPDSSEIWGSLASNPRQQGATLQSQLQQVKEGMREYFKLVIDAEDALTLDGQPALRLRYHHFQSAAGQTYAGITVIVQRPGDFLILALQYAADRQQSYGPALDQIIGSMQASRP